MRSDRELPGWLSGALVGAAFAACVYLERRFPLRRETEPKARRDARNLVIAALSGATLAAFERPITSRLTKLVERRRWGLLKRRRLPPAVELVAAVVLMDYTLTVWHVLTHKVPVLRRFHRAHHADRDLDATTAIRFHPGEMALSIPWRAAQIVGFGVSPLALSVWQTATTMEILFHHANIRLPERLERWLSYVIVTPRMHGIHHSEVPEEMDSNWSTIFSFPDRLHRTLRLDVPQEAVTIGLPEPREPAELTFGKVLAYPFGAAAGAPQPKPPSSPPARITGARHPAG